MLRHCSTPANCFSFIICIIKIRIAMKRKEEKQTGRGRCYAIHRHPKSIVCSFFCSLRSDQNNAHSSSFFFSLFMWTTWLCPHLNSHLPFFFCWRLRAFVLYFFFDLCSPSGHRGLTHKHTLAHRQRQCLSMSVTRWVVRGKRVCVGVVIVPFSLQRSQLFIIFPFPVNDF